VRYSGWQRSLRAYNGWNSPPCTNTRNYVDDVLSDSNKNVVLNLFPECGGTIATSTTILDIRTVENKLVTGSFSLTSKDTSVIPIGDYITTQEQIKIPLQVEKIQVFTQQNKNEVIVSQDNVRLEAVPLEEVEDFDEVVPKEFKSVSKPSSDKTVEIDPNDINALLKKNNIEDEEIIINLETPPEPIPPSTPIEVPLNIENEPINIEDEPILSIDNKQGISILKLPLNKLKSEEVIKCEDVTQNKVAKLEGSKYSCNPSSSCRTGFNLGQLNCGAGNSCCRPACEISYSGFECTDTTQFTCLGNIQRGYCPGGNEIVCCKKGSGIVSSDSNEFTSNSLINKKILEIINGDKSFASNLKICEGTNCAGFVSVSFDYIFGIGRRFVTGVYGSAWEIPGNVKSLGDGSATFYNWRAGQTFTNYDSLNPGDILGFYYTESYFEPNDFYQDINEAEGKYGYQRGNTEDIDFTHVGLYLGESNGKHYITHFIHSGGDDVRVESLEDFLFTSPYAGQMHIRSVIKPNQAKLYKEPPIYETQYYTIKSGDSILGIASSINNELTAQENAWLISYYNSIFEPNYLESGKKIFVPTSKVIVSSGSNVGYNNVVSSLAIKINEKYNKDDQDNFGYDWARIIYDTSKYKDPEYLSLVASIIDTETSFNTQSGEKTQQVTFNLLPSFLKDSLYTNKGKDIGCMDIKICKAIKLQKEITANEKEAKKIVYDTITSKEGCVFYGEKYLSRVAESHLSVSGKFDEGTINKILLDYVAGEYGSRNAAVQKQLNELTGANLKLDGDFLIYEENCEISNLVSQSQKVAESFVSIIMEEFNDNSIQISQVRNMLIKEKTREFENTLIYKKIKQYYKEKILNNKAEPEYTIITEARRYSGTSITFVNEVLPNYNHYCKEICTLT
ncbi:MAG: DUF1615 family protein, partial [archaeon]